VVCFRASQRKRAKVPFLWRDEEAMHAM